MGPDVPIVRLRRAVVLIDGKTILGPVDLDIGRSERWLLLGQDHTADARWRETTALDVVLTGRRSSLVTWFDPISESERSIVRARLAEVGAEHLAAQPLASCSQGERQRILLARALFGRPDLLTLDEPSAGLDFPARELLITALETAADRPDAPTALLATHHLEEVPPSTTHAALLRAGRAVAVGPVEGVLTADRLAECFGVPIEVGRRNGRWCATSST